MSVNAFHPAKRTGSELDRALRESLIESLNWCFAQAGTAKTAANRAPDDWEPCPVDYARYYDMVQLLLDPVVKDSEQSKARIAALIRTTQDTWQYKGPDLGSTAETRITTLAPPWFNEDELDCIVRWFDMEPENAMNLAPLDEASLSAGRTTLKQALKALEDLAPGFHGEFTATVREIILARPGGGQKLTFRGVSSFALWGALALNVDQHPHWRNYLPSLVHEYSHNILFAMARHGPLVENPSEQLYYSPLRNEERPMDGIYHAAFVSAREAVAMNQALDCLTEGDVPQHYLEQEAYFRQVRDASSISCRDCVEVLDAEARLTELGSTILQDTKSAMRENGLWQ